MKQAAREVGWGPSHWFLGGICSNLAMRNGCLPGVHGGSRGSDDSSRRSSSTTSHFCLKSLHSVELCRNAWHRLLRSMSAWRCRPVLTLALALPPRCPPLRRNSKYRLLPPEWELHAHCMPTIPQKRYAIKWHAPRWPPSPPRAAQLQLPGTHRAAGHHWWVGGSG